MSVATSHAEVAEATLRAARRARASGDHHDAHLLAHSTIAHARAAYQAAHVGDPADANAVQRAQKCAGEAADMTANGGMRGAVAEAVAKLDAIAERRAEERLELNLDAGVARARLDALSILHSVGLR